MPTAQQDVKFARAPPGIVIRNEPWRSTAHVARRAADRFIPGGIERAAQEYVVAPGRNPAKPARGMHMFTLKQKGKLAALAACCMLSLAAPARAESAAQYRSQFGASVDAGKYDREILVTANTRWVNVVAGQVIRFVIADASGATVAFTWHFDTFGGRVADLSQLAPAGMVQRSIKIYIANDPRYGAA